MENTVQFPPIPVSILGLSDVEIVSVVINRENQFIFKVISTKKEIICRCCGKLIEPNGYSQTILLRHLLILGRKTFIEITPARGRCKDCDGNPTTTQKLDWYDRKSPHTKAYEKHILLLLVNSTIVIENYFLNRNTSGFVEGVNNKAKVMKRRCYGIYNLKHFFQRLTLDFSGYAVFGNSQKACTM